SSVSFKISGVSPGSAVIAIFQTADPSFEDYCTVTVTDPDLSFIPTPISVNYGHTIPVVISRPAGDMGAELQVTLRSGSRCTYGLGTDASVRWNYASEIGLVFGPQQQTKIIYLTGMSFEDNTEPLRAVVGTYIETVNVNCSGYVNTMPSATPVFSSIVAGDSRYLFSVSSMPSTTNFPPATIRFISEDDTRIQITNRFDQVLSGLSHYFTNYIFSATGVRRLNNLFEPVRINITTTYELNESMGGCILGNGIWWTNSVFIFPLDPTFEFRAPSDVRVGDTYPLVIRRIGMEAGANLFFDLYSDDETVLGLGPTNLVIQTNKHLQVVFQTFEWSKTVYVSGRALTENYSTNIKITAQVGSYLTNTLIQVSPNAGLVLSPLTPQISAGDVISMTVSRPNYTNVSDLTVYLASENPQFVAVPESVVILAGAQSASFPVTGLLPGFSIVRATAVGVSNSVDSMRTVAVVNPDLSFIPTIVSNAVGQTVVVAIKRPASQAGSDLKVDLQSSSPSIFEINTNSITISAGYILANVTINCLSEGAGTMEARVGAYVTSLQVIVGQARDADDPDGDGLNSQWEAYLGSDPNNAHTWDPNVDDGQYDTDHDGLGNLNEIETYKTDPLRYDTDDDMVPDGTEVSEDLTWPLHPMSSRLYHERSLSMSDVPAGGLAIPNASRFAFRTNGWSVEFWFRPQQDGDGEIFSMGRDGTNTGFWVGLENYRPKVEIFTGTNLLVYAGGTNAQPVGDIQQLPTNEWSHVACVWAPYRNSLEVYVDGILLIARETLAFPDFTSGRAYMGRNLSSGYIDDLRVWDFDRSWDEISYWHNRIFPAPSGYVRTPTYGGTMKLYYRFDDG
ncbi:MAG: LamG-like jellyroll fold domain-containing protein, partial [Lentisphaerota bacterium]